MRTVLTLVIDQRKVIPNLADIVANRAYTVDGVTGVRIEGVVLDMPDGWPVLEQPFPKEGAEA